ncbi:MAG: hypothetical protein NC906_05105, partial [Candidatus Omnitrophica bacterium]|nr:hypothetical protein [Candidatus Omnitrophota bacterium]
YPQGGRFLKRGVPVNRAHFKVEQWNSTGQGLSCEKELPDIWVNDYIVGQNTIPWPDYWNTSRQNILIKGRETLLSLDVVTNYSSISGVRFKAIFDGKEIEPLNPSFVLGRSVSISGNDIFYGKATLNFILPPTQADVANVLVMMDTTNISGFDDAQGKGEKVLLNIDLTFSSAYKRQLNILVQPVQLFITGYTRKIPNGSAVANSLKNLIPAMFPIDQSQLHIWTAPVTTFYGGILSMFSTTALLNRIANYLALGQGTVNTTAAIGDWLSGDETARIDFIIAVMPKGVLGEGVTGANLALRRGIIFVDESAPDAALHEIGHGIGLYISPEQYDQFPPAGLPVEKLTAFINDANSRINGFRYRLLHFPGKDHPWYENRYWYDIMGSSTTLIWPIWNTLTAFRNYFRLSLLGAEKKSTISGTKVPAGYKRIFVSGETEKTSSGGYGYKFKQGTVKAFDITDFATGKIDVGVQWNSDDCASNDYTLICYDQNGTEIYSQQFTIITPYPMNFGWINLPNESSFCGTFDIPEQTRSYKIFPRPGWWNNNTDQPIFEVVYDTPIPIEIVSPTPGSVLSDSVEISWAASGKKQTNTSMQYAIMVSTDGGETWTPIGAPVEANKITLPTDFLTSSNNIIFKVIGSNGLDTTEDQVENLVLENRPPKAVIVSPLNNWVANTGTVWQFNGYGSDHEDGIIPTGIWTSSIDGTLNTDTDIVLSKGVHIITFEVQDSQGLKGSTTVQVEVKDMETVDIGIDDGNLTILIPNRDPLNSSPVLWLKENSVHNAVLKIKNTGTDTIFKASLYIKEPDSSQQRLLASNVFVPGPFEEVVLSETFLVATEGQYRFRAELTEITPPDENPANNEKIWTFQTKQAGLPVIQILPDLLDFDVSGSRKEGVFLIRNTGTDNLYITSLGISGQNPGEFSVDQTILNIPIPPDNEILVPVYFNPSSPGSKTAILNIFSNDVVNSPLRIELKGLCSAVKGDINSDGTTDISDVILCLRQAIGLDPVNVAAADMNDDGVVDISDVILVLRKAIGLD